MFWFMLQVDPIQSFLNLKIGLPPVLKAGSSGIGFWLASSDNSLLESWANFKIDELSGTVSRNDFLRISTLSLHFA